MHDFQATSKENIQRKRDCFFEKYVAVNIVIVSNQMFFKLF
jgi:hypothetical protein